MEKHLCWPTFFLRNFFVLIHFALFRLGGLGIFLYKKHKKNKEFNEPYSYDDDPDMSEFGPVTQRPLGSVGQHEGSDGASYSQYHGQPPPLGNAIQQPGPGGAYTAGAGGAFSQYGPGSVASGGAPYGGSGDYGQYPIGFIPSGDYRHSLSTGSQENDIADHSLQSSRHESQILGPGGGGGHYRGPSDLSYEVTYPPNEVAAPPVPGHKPNTLD